MLDDSIQQISVEDLVVISNDLNGHMDKKEWYLKS